MWLLECQVVNHQFSVQGVFPVEMHDAKTFLIVVEVCLEENIVKLTSDFLSEYFYLLSSE